MKEVSIIIKNLKELLNGGHAHATFEQAVEKLPAKLQSQVPEGMPYSIWQLVEHIRITQFDILEFSRDPDYESPKWPEGYWPDERAPKNAAAWEESIRQIANDRKAFIELLEAPRADLFTLFPHGSGQNLLREAMLIADHTSYHTGEIIVLRRLMGAWK
ncbi:DinB family protein [Chitinophaga cymbidii]|uniref:DinB-like domain-containing protein n=1 Tax=Chitinophaga cymbidii TaxID=1096750 RepID=A0A512RKD2_9BACT|nr:DinB family protein [Chitinophaga cymbidii]GEP96154.1 hypothetical protein CCY01nite_24140 [Chitinophaga cymbidii]